MRIGLGPVFWYEWLATSRKRSIYFGRFAFGAMLLIVLALTDYSMKQDATTTGTPAQSGIRQQASTGRQFSAVIIATGLSLVLLAAPATTAGAVCLDKQRGTLMHLLMTDLSNSEIILGKLAARLLPAVGLVLISFGVSSIATLMGGVDPMALGGAFLVTLGSAVLVASLALCLSVWAGKTHEVLLGTYFLILAWVLSPAIWFLFAEAHLVPVGPPDWVHTLSPFEMALNGQPGEVPIHEHFFFLLGCLAISMALTALATLRVRAVANGQGGPRRSLWVRISQWRIARPIRIGRGPSLDGNPILWREWHRARPSRWTRFFWTLFVVIWATGTIYGIYLCFLPTTLGQHEAGLIIVNGLGVSVGLLLLSVSAATALAEERVRGSLDVVLTTPLSTRSIVWGKWLGTFRSAPKLAILPTLLCAAAAWNHEIKASGFLGTAIPPKMLSPWYGVAVIAGLTVAYGAAITSVGLLLATWTARLGRAIAGTVALYLFMAVAYLFLVMIIRPNSGVGGSQALALGLASGSPFMAIAYTGSLLGELHPQQYRLYPAQLAWGLFWIMAYLSVAAGLLLATMATFNCRLGRTNEDGSSPSPNTDAQRRARATKRVPLLETPVPAGSEARVGELLKR